jgi:hypothetical protein
MYLELVSIPLVYRDVYKFSIGEASLIYITQVIGSVGGFGLEFYCSRLYLRNVAKRGSEARLYTACEYCSLRTANKAHLVLLLRLSSLRWRLLPSWMLDLRYDSSIEYSLHRARNWSRLSL